MNNAADTDPGTMQIFGEEITRALAQARADAVAKRTKIINVNGAPVSVRYPFPSPTDWRDCWMYFLILDRFANDQAPPKSQWNQRYEYRQGGTFRGVTAPTRLLARYGSKSALAFSDPQEPATQLEIQLHWL